MTANTPAEAQPVNPAYAALFNSVTPERQEELEKNNVEQPSVSSPGIFVLGENGPLNNKARTGLTKIVKGKAVAPKIGTLFIEDNGEYVELSANTQLYLLAHELYARFFIDRTKSESKEVVGLTVASVGDRGPRNAEGARPKTADSPATTGMVETVKTAVVAYCPDADKAFAACITSKKAGTRMTKALFSGTFPFINEDTFKDSADVLGLSKAQIKARIKDEPAFPSFRAGVETMTSIDVSKRDGKEYTVWEVDASTLAAPDDEVLAALKEATKTEQAQRCAESVMKTMKFVADMLAKSTKEVEGE